MNQVVLTEIDNSVAIITLNRPEKHNAFDEALIAELTAALRNVDAAPNVRVVVLSAAGKSFSAGADLHWMRRMADFSEEENARDAMGLAELMNTLATLSKPTVARVQGAAYGGGVGLVACCDIAVGSHAAAFALSEVRIGLIPAVISPYVIAAIGRRAAQRWFLTGERFDAAEAWRLGLLHELVEDDDTLDARVGELVDTLLLCGPAAVSEAKQLIPVVTGRPIDAHLMTETAMRIARVRASDEGCEGVDAFLNKRQPNWLLTEEE